MLLFLLHCLRTPEPTMEHTLRRFGTWLSQSQKPRWTEGPDKTSRQSSRPTPHASESTTSELLCGRVLPNSNPLSDAEGSALVTGAICTAAATAGGTALARPVANAITHVANTVAAVPAAETRDTAIAMLAAVTEYAGILKNHPDKPFTAIYDRARSAVPVGSLPAVSEALPEALGNIGHVMSAAKVWERTHLATAIVMAITRATSAVACVSADYRQTAATTYSTIADRAADRVGDGIPKRPVAINNKPPPADTNRASCEAVLQAVQLEAALYGVQSYTEQLWHAEAASALGAVAGSACLSGPVNEWPSATCTCGKDSGSCQAVVRVRRMRAVLQALWSYNMRVGHHEAVDALAAVATGACFPSSPERPVVDELDESMAAVAIPRISGAPSPPPNYSAQH